MSIEIESVGQLAKVTAISDSGHTAFFELRNGSTGSLTNSKEHYAIGDILIISGDMENNIDVSVTKAPPTTWPNSLWIGIVKLKLSDITIIESGGRFRQVPTNSQLDYAVGNTVQAGEYLDVTRVLSEKAIKYVELGRVPIRGFVIFEDMIQAPNLRELGDGPLRSDGLRMASDRASAAEQAPRRPSGGRSPSVERHSVGASHGGAVA